MQTIVSPDQMRAAEAEAMAAMGVPSIVLMERAAQRVVEELVRRLGTAAGKTVVFACGPGMNGGDGYAAARLFAGENGRAIVLPLYPWEQLKGDAYTNADAARRTANVFFADAHRVQSMPRPDGWVDALFGIGLARAVDGEYRRVIDRMARDRAEGALVLAVDIPSGIGPNGEAMGAAVQADVTITFEYPKYGHFLGEGLDATGELITRPIGIDAGERPDAARLVERGDLPALFAPRRRNTHKNQYGHLLIIAGSLGMAGAALLATKAALLSGAGLVTLAAPESIVPIVQSGAPCAMCVPLPERDGAIADGAADLLKKAFEGKTALAIGPGLSRGVGKEIVRAALERDLPALFDADALNLIAGDAAYKALLGRRHVITPHPGEAARLLGRAMTDPVADAKALRALGPVALLKGAATVVCGENVTISISGSPGMAKGGSGDVLTGIIGALLARGVDPERAAWAGSELHGLAGEAAARALGETAMGPMDMIGHLPALYHALEREYIESQRPKPRASCGCGCGGAETNAPQP